jgi:hypothetical protein
MAETKNFLQTIKLEISKNFKLTPYERIAFHHLLSLLRSESGRGILSEELERGAHVRRNAVTVLSEFMDKEVGDILIPLLDQDITINEMIRILHHIDLNGEEERWKDIAGFIRRHLHEPDRMYLPLARAFRVLGSLVSGDEEAFDFIMGIINSDEVDRRVRQLAITSLSAFQVISHFEKLLRDGDEESIYEVYKTLYNLCLRSLEHREASRQGEEEELFTFDTESEDKIILDIRVLLGKMAHQFDEYSNRVKIVYISTMMISNHREYLIYAMKALTSPNPELIRMVLFAIYSSIDRVRDPDKLFRSLISLTTETDEDNRLIVQTFYRYFSHPRKNRQFHILQDKLYSYIVVTLESYFETYRKDFMITDVIEKDYPESFQKMRRFVLERFNPELKKKLTNFLRNEEPGLIQHIVMDMSKWIHRVEGEEKDALAVMLDVLMDSDKKSRENSASRIENINFEKRYLRNRIIRLCEIISVLKIEEGASTLVNIYNYLKKYPDRPLFSATERTLSSLNYSYMLGEVEVALMTGTPEDQSKALNNIALFNEQRSLNILFEFLQKNAAETSYPVSRAMEILLERDIRTNVTGRQICRTIIEQNETTQILKNAVLGLGQCAYIDDLEYLDLLFRSDRGKDLKEEIIRSIGMILTYGSGYNRRQVMRMLNEYLKDPGIRVRIYSCLFLARLGDTDAIRAIREMLVIKNKSIQRDILTILGDLRSVEFSFFLVSLLREEYGIMRDIIPIVAKLPSEELQEIDSFIVNLFRKYEAPERMEIGEEEKRPREIQLEGLKSGEMTLLNIELLSTARMGQKETTADLIQHNLIFKKMIYNEIESSGGIIARMTPEQVLCFFPDSSTAARTALKIRNNFNEYNSYRRQESHLYVTIQVITDRVDYLNEELIEYPDFRLHRLAELSFANKVIVGENTLQKLKDEFLVRVIPDFIISRYGCFLGHAELIETVNFMETSENILETMKDEDEKKKQIQQQIDEELKKMKLKKSEGSSAAMSRELEAIGDNLKKNLDEIERYVQRRSTDRELLRNVRKMLANTYDFFKVDISRIIIE